MGEPIALEQREQLETVAALFIEEAVAETAVLTGGIPAEYGRFTEGVVSEAEERRKLVSGS